MDLQLNGKRALVTGSSSGIGRAIATILAGEGAVVVVHGRNREATDETAATIRAAGGTAYIAIGDLATADGAAAVVTAVSEQVGGVDILINNIGGTESSAGSSKRSWFDSLPEYWAGSMEQNLISAVRMIHGLVPAMCDRGWGRVINISSAGATSSIPSVPDYCAAKAGLLSLTVSLSKELARSGVTVNAVSPGCTRTRMFDVTLDRMAQANGWPDDYESREAKFMDMGMFPCVSKHFGLPEDIGALVAFLASPLGAFANGANYRIDGGQVPSVN